MKQMTRMVFSLAAAVAILSEPGLAGGQAQTVEDQAQEASRRELHDRWVVELSNAGRWGAGDDLGTLNLITEEKRRDALALARRGVVVSLQLPIVLRDKDEEVQRDGRPSGVAFHEIRFKTFPADDPRGNAGFTSDVQEVSVHGGRVTHLDALCHESDRGVMYNGFELSGVVSPEAGCAQLGMDRLAGGIVTRGVLVDLSLVRTAGGQRQGPASRADVDAWERRTGIRVSAGDAVFFFDPATEATAFDDSVVPWLKARDVAVVAGPDREQHRLVLVALGAYVLDNPDLTVLAERARALQRWEFLLVVAPIPTPGATGSSINPLAMF